MVAAPLQLSFPAEKTDVPQWMIDLNPRPHRHRAVHRVVGGTYRLELERMVGYAQNSNGGLCR